MGRGRSPTFLSSPAMSSNWCSHPGLIRQKRLLAISWASISGLAIASEPSPPRQGLERTILVNSATEAWQDSGIDVVAGQILRVAAAGKVFSQIDIGNGPPSYFNPDGIGNHNDGTEFVNDAVLPSAIAYSLIAKVGGSTVLGTGTPVPEGVRGKGAGFVGSSYIRKIPSSGRLFFAFNDQLHFFGDNSGTFKVAFEVVPEHSMPSSTEKHVRKRRDDGNLIVNGDFEQGNSGFTSSYSHRNIGYEGAYDVVTNPHLPFSLAASYRDHTTGSGLMMAVNGSPVSNTLVWSETVSVTQNTQYDFSAWVSTWDPAYADAAKLDFILNGQTISFTAPNTPAKWRQFATTWNSGSSNSLKIEIYDRNLHRLGNDFALDDISLTAVPERSSTRPSTERHVRELAKYLDGVKIAEPIVYRQLAVYPILVAQPSGAPIPTLRRLRRCLNSQYQLHQFVVRPPANPESTPETESRYSDIACGSC